MRAVHTEVPRVRYTRTPYLVVSSEPAARKDVYGSIDSHVVRQAQLMRPPEDSDTVVVGMHPIGSPGYLPAFSRLAGAGLHVIACSTRYATGDAPLQMENVLLDLAACVRDARDRLGYQKIVLAGWSGGGSLMAGYQAEAEHRRITQTAAGERTALLDTDLSPGDGLILMAAHRSRHRLLTDFLDPSITDERDPAKRLVDLNIYDVDNPNKPPYTPEYVARYREAQRARNRRITEMAVERYDEMQRTGRYDDEYCFVVHGTMADLRWVDPTVDPNDRRAGWSYLGDPRIANDSASGLARFCTTRGWLSQWSLDRAQVDAVDAAPRITVPTLVVVNSADDACPNSHPQDFFDAVGSRDKRMHTIVGANHYFSGDDPSSRGHLESAAQHVLDWMSDSRLQTS